jgi:hypothetical protein
MNILLPRRILLLLLVTTVHHNIHAMSEEYGPKRIDPSKHTFPIDCTVLGEAHPIYINNINMAFLNDAQIILAYSPSSDFQELTLGVFDFKKNTWQEKWKATYEHPTRVAVYTINAHKILIVEVTRTRSESTWRPLSCYSHQFKILDLETREACAISPERYNVTSIHGAFVIDENRLAITTRFDGMFIDDFKNAPCKLSLDRLLVASCSSATNIDGKRIIFTKDLGLGSTDYIIVDTARDSHIATVAVTTVTDPIKKIININNHIIAIQHEDSITLWNIDNATLHARIHNFDLHPSNKINEIIDIAALDHEHIAIAFSYEVNENNQIHHVSNIALWNIHEKKPNVCFIVGQDCYLGCLATINAETLLALTRNTPLAHQAPVYTIHEYSVDEP